MAALFCAVGAWGCSAGPQQRVVWDRAALEGETFTAHSPRFVLGTPQREPTAAEVETGPPWWLTRNDTRLNARGDGGRGGTELIHYTVRTEDRKRSHPGHIHNTYRRTFHSTQHGHVVR